MIKTLETDKDLTEGILSADERIVWSGRPIPSRHLFPAMVDIFGFLVAVYLTASIISRTVPAVIGAGFAEGDAGLWPLNPFIILPFLITLFGVGMLLLPFFRYWLATRTQFVVTNKRALIISDGIKRKIRGFSNFTDLYTDLRKDGSGNLFIGQPRGRFIFSGRYKSILKRGFVGLKNVAEVEAHIRTLMNH